MDTLPALFPFSPWAVFCPPSSSLPLKCNRLSVTFPSCPEVFIVWRCTHRAPPVSSQMFHRGHSIRHRQRCQAAVTIVTVLRPELLEVLQPSGGGGGSTHLTTRICRAQCTSLPGRLQSWQMSKKCVTSPQPDLAAAIKMFRVQSSLLIDIFLVVFFALHFPKIHQTVQAVVWHLTWLSSLSLAGSQTVGGSLLFSPATVCDCVAFLTTCSCLFCVLIWEQVSEVFLAELKLNLSWTGFLSTRCSRVKKDRRGIVHSRKPSTPRMITRTFSVMIKIRASTLMSDDVMYTVTVQLDDLLLLRKRKKTRRVVV